jgi:choline-glycine betaine transporter
LLEWRSSITLNFTWLFIGTRVVFFFFLLFIAYKFGHIKLAPTPDEEPEFSTGSYFMMIFAAGVAVALFVYGVAEPLWHQNSHYFAQQSYRTQDEVDQFAINMTVTNWGFTAWAPYLIVAVSMGLAGHRFGLPMTFRSCFYPILGEYAWGWMGDVIDGFTIVTTVAGVCTSLGLGAINIVAGFQFLGWVDDDVSQDRLTLIQNLTIWGCHHHGYPFGLEWSSPGSPVALADRLCHWNAPLFLDFHHGTLYLPPEMSEINHFDPSHLCCALCRTIPNS